jgi:hypothetical protein
VQKYTAKADFQNFSTKSEKMMIRNSRLLLKIGDLSRELSDCSAPTMQVSMTGCATYTAIPDVTTTTAAGLWLNHYNPQRGFLANFS